MAENSNFAVLPEKLGQFRRDINTLENAAQNTNNPRSLALITDRLTEAKQVERMGFNSLVASILE